MDNEFLYVWLVLFILILWFIFGMIFGLRRTVLNGTIVRTVVEEGNTAFIFRHDNEDQDELIINQDSFWAMKFNSRDFVTRIEPGKHYRIVVNGVRIPLFSMSRNIIRFKETPVPTD